MIELRPYQTRGVRAIMAAFAAGHRRVLAVAPTGYGKGTAAAWLLNDATVWGDPSTLAVHRREIVLDVADRVRRAGLDARVGVIVAGEPRDPEALVQVCSIQTLTASGERPPGALVVIDEAHHATATTYRAILGAYPEARILGLTATPERADGAAMGDAFQALVVLARISELTRAGYLVPCDVIGPASYGEALASDPVDAWLRHAAGRRTFCFAANVDHGFELVGQFRARGVPADLVVGKTGKRARREAIDRFRTGETQVLVNVYALTEGIDVPEAEVCMLARGCGSAGMFLQCVGRVLRPASGKTRALLLDLRGAVHLHGLPGEDRVFSLEGRAIRRGAEDTVALRTCRACFAIHSPGPDACPSCGAAYPPPPRPRVRARDLIHIRAAESTEAKRETYERFLAEQRARGHKPGAAAFRFKGKYGELPPRAWGWR